MIQAPFTTFLDLHQQRHFLVPIEKVDLWILVLESQGIDYWLDDPGFEDFLLIVPAHQGIAAYDQLWRCERLENKEQETPSEIEEPSSKKNLPLPITPALLCFLITYVFFQYGSLEKNYQELQIYIFSSQDILNGQYYRLVTALSLHSDFWHYLSNLFALYLLSKLANNIYGNLSSLWLIIFSAILGNFFNLLYYYNEVHLSAGSSTAVFSTLGLLAGHSFRSSFKKQTKQYLRHYFTPLISALALLAILGTGGENVDFSAHFFGLLAGVITSFSYLINSPPALSNNRY